MAADFTSIIPRVRSISDNSFDVGVIDPPYKRGDDKKYGERYGKELIRYAKSDPTCYTNIHDTQYYRNYFDNAVYRIQVDRLGALCNYFCFFLRSYNAKRKTFTEEMYDYHYYA
jgi:endo-alpha-1,4-polygalactosaminidase (GH114 family)